MEDEVKVTMVAAAFPIPQEQVENNDEELRQLLRDALPDETEDLEIPSFLRKQTTQRKRGFFR